MFMAFSLSKSADKTRRFEPICGVGPSPCGTRDLGMRKLICMTSVFMGFVYVYLLAPEVLTCCSLHTGRSVNLCPSWGQ